MIDDELDVARHAAEKMLEELRAQSAQVLADYDAEISRIIESHGKTRCTDCGGLGARERLDSGTMRRFGMREWEGCTKCGGGKGVRGKGYI